MKLISLVGSLYCLLVFSSAGSAQSASVSGDIRGTITDPSSAVLPKATITATVPQTGLHRTARAAESWDMHVEGPNGFERSYSLSGAAGEHEPATIRTLVVRLIPPARP